MPQPIHSNLTPDDLSTDADIGEVSLVWTAADLDDPLDPALFTIERNGVAFPVQALALGGGAFRVSADVGLFPDDSGVVIEAFAETEGGETNTVTWSFDCRTSGVVSMVSDVGMRGPMSASAIAELPNINPEITGATVFGDLVPAPALAFFEKVEFRAGDFGSVGEFTLAKVSAARSFLILAGRGAVGSGEPDIAPGSHSETADQGSHGRPALVLFNSDLGQRKYSVKNQANAGRENKNSFTGRASLTTGDEVIDELDQAAEIASGSGVDSQFDLADATLDGLTDD